MTNKHIKVINGRKYYYSSIRKGKKVTSKYIGPVERLRKKRKNTEEPLAEQQIQEQELGGMDVQEDDSTEEDSYIG